MTRPVRRNPPIAPARLRTALRRAGSLRLLEALLALATVVVACGAFLPFFDGLTWVPAVVGAAVLGGVLAAGGILAGFRWWITLAALAVSLLALLHYAGYAAHTWHGVPTAESMRSLGQGLATGLTKTLALELPVDVRGDLLGLPLLLAGAAGAAAVALVLRTRVITPLVLPAVLVFLSGTALTASRAGPGIVAAGVVVAALFALLLLRSNRISAAEDEGIAASDAEAVGLDLGARRRQSLRGRLTLGLPAVALVAVLAVVAGWLVPIADGAHRTDPRRLYHQPFALRSALSPLAQVGPGLTQASEPVFTVRVRHDTTPRLDRVRVATLDRFDGALWSGTGDYRLTGSRLPGPEPIAGRPVEVRLDVSVIRLPQPFLPVTGEPVRFSGVDFAFDRATDTVVSTRSDVAGLRYSVVGEVRPLDRALREASPSRRAADASLMALPDVPEWVSRYANAITANSHTALGQLLAIEAYLRGRPYSPQAAPGHSYGALYRTLSTPDGVGDAEQYAAAFAVLARFKGYATRVAVGYRLRAKERTGDVYQVLSTDIHAWPEVHLQGFGWVPFEPTATDNPVADVPPRSPEVTLQATAGDQAPQQPLDAGDPNGSGRTGAGGVVTRTALVAGLVLAGVAGLALLVALAKRLRRRFRRRRGPPDGRIVGAWRETTDRLLEVGIHLRSSLTGSEVAEELVGSPAAVVRRSVDELAAAVAAAVFAYDEPDEAAARRAWQLYREIQAGLGSALAIPRRLRGLIDPRPLVPRLRRRRRRTAQARPPRRSAVEAASRES